MKLIQDHVIKLGDDRITLRPTLRCAMVLESRYGFDRLLHDLANGSLTAIADVIVEASELDHFHVSALLAYVPTKEAIETLAPQCFAFVLALSGYDHSDAKQSTPTKQTKAATTFADYHERLYGIATGVLGWTPAETWDCTAAEILIAYKARQGFVGDILKACFGGTDDKPVDGPVEHTPEEIAAGKATLKSLVAAGANRGIR